MVEGVHFSFHYMMPYDVGHRLMTANLSDIAAMGGTPKQIVLSVAAPQQIDTEQYNNLPQTTDENGSDSTNAEDNGQYGFQIESPNGFTETNAKPVYFSNKSSIERLTPSTNEMPNIEISKVVFADNDGNNILKRGEIGKIAFEIHNNGTQAISDLYPTITEATNSNRFRISPTTRIDVLMPGETVRYTATIVADRKVKTGEYSFAIAILKDNRSIARVTELRLKTQK